MGNKVRDRKRQKTVYAAELNGSRNNPTALLEDDSLKGQEELQLETLLFGKPSKQSVSTKSPIDVQMDADLGHLMDNDVS